MPVITEKDDGTIEDLKLLLSSRNLIQVPGTIKEKKEDFIIDLIWKPETSPWDIPVDWQKKPPKKIKTTHVKCIVVDRYNRWHENILIDLKGIDTTGFSWTYYGSNFPVLVETARNVLKPWRLHDTVGENSNRLYKAANPEGFRNTFKHKSTFLQKIQVGLMVGLILGLFFLMFVMISQ